MKRLAHVRLPRARPRGGDQSGAGPTAHREGGSRLTVWRVATPVVGLLSGTLFVVSAHSSEGTDLRPGRYTDLASFVRVDAAQYDALKQRVADLNTQISLLNSQSNNRQVRQVSEKATRMKQLAGLMPASGDGIVVTLSDAPQSTTADTTLTSDNRNLLVVHQQDIQAVVNAMWKGGATAVTIQGQRVVGTTGIRCIGNAVQLQGVPYSQPYVIAAVGDPTTMSAAIARDAYLQTYREDAADPNVNVGWDLSVQHLELPGYDGLLGLSYAKVLSPSGS
jgi:uncharacterized protein YlxW (UPF0749 family)